MQDCACTPRTPMVSMGRHGFIPNGPHGTYPIKPPTGSGYAPPGARFSIDYYEAGVGLTLLLRPQPARPPASARPHGNVRTRIRTCPRIPASCPTYFTAGRLRRAAPAQHPGQRVLHLNVRADPETPGSLRTGGPNRPGVPCRQTCLRTPGQSANGSTSATPGPGQAPLLASCEPHGLPGWTVQAPAA
jgi:hypothetical protein